MGIIQRAKDRKKIKYITSAFKLINNYTPAFSSFSGGVYEMALTRAAINSIATHCYS